MLSENPLEKERCLQVPLFSVVVPIYNVEKYLSLCLDHLRGQGFGDFEVICVDDGSTDSSCRIAEMQAALDPRITILKKENGGVSSARNAGMNAAKGEYVLFVDSDDYLGYDALEVLAAVVKDNDPDIVTFGADCIPSWATYPWLEKCLSPRDIVYERFDQAILFEEASTPFSWRTLFKRDFLIENNIWYNESLSLGEDQVFLFEAYPCSKKTVFISDKLYCYRLSRKGSAMDDLYSDVSGRVEKHLQVVENILASWKSNRFINFCPAELLDWILDFTFENTYRLPPASRALAFSALGNLLLTNFDDVVSVARSISPRTAKVVNSLLSCAAGDVVPSDMGRQYTVSKIGWSGYIQNLALRVMDHFRNDQDEDSETTARQKRETLRHEEEAAASLRMLSAVYGLLEEKNAKGLVGR